MSNVWKEHLFEEFFETFVPELVYQEFNKLRIEHWIAIWADNLFDEIGEVFTPFEYPTELMHAHYHYCLDLFLLSKFAVD